MLPDGKRSVQLSSVPRVVHSVPQGPPRARPSQGASASSSNASSQNTSPAVTLVDKKKKIVSTPDGVDGALHGGYKDALAKFGDMVATEALAFLEANPPENATKSLSEIADDRAHGACRRLTMGISSIVSWVIEHNKPLPTFDDMLLMSNEQIASYCMHYHGSYDGSKKSNIFSDIYSAFAKYRGLMMVKGA